MKKEVKIAAATAIAIALGESQKECNKCNGCGKDCKDCYVQKEQNTLMLALQAVYNTL